MASEPEAQKKNAMGIQNYGPSGAPIWNSPTIDIEREQLYVGTGENYSLPATTTSDAILALSLDTGNIRWVYQATLGDAWNTACGRQRRANCPQEDGPDFDFGAPAVLATDSQGRDFVLGPQKSGAVHAIDPDTGEGIWRTRIGRGGLHGGVHFGIALSGDRVFIPISDAGDGRDYPTPANPGLFAISLSDGTSLWQSPQPDECHGREFCDQGIGAAITATPSFVFAGALDGYLRIHDTATGEIVRRIDTTQAVTTVSGTQSHGGSMDGGTAPLPFGGRLYVNSGYNFAGHMAGNVLLVYGPK
jgi:polyvinyl alcohol dehydrogenase (cytochrome)